MDILAYHQAPETARSAAAPVDNGTAGTQNVISLVVKRTTKCAWTECPMRNCFPFETF